MSGRKEREGENYTHPTDKLKHAHLTFLLCSWAASFTLKQQQNTLKIIQGRGQVNVRGRKTETKVRHEWMKRQSVWYVWDEGQTDR